MIAIAVCSHLTMLKRDVSYLVAAPMLSIMRVLYPMSISWMILAGHTGHGGALTTILNHPIFMHINKLSYAIYLLNPAVIILLYGWQDHSTHIHPVSMVR